ncbi:MAG: hypothetical protein FWC41_08975 [Firmicutes bacterium]|nr:hypothetical protein [Bacillota bacterium]
MVEFSDKYCPQLNNLAYTLKSRFGIGGSPVYPFENFDPSGFNPKLGLETFKELLAELKKIRNNRPPRKLIFKIN